MPKLCIIGVDDHKVLKDFIRAHVEYLDGEKVCIDHWYPDYTHDGRTIIHVLHHDGPRTNHGVRADSDSLPNDRTDSDMGSFTDKDRSPEHGTG